VGERGLKNPMASSDEKDRYGEKLRHLGKAREEQWARQTENALLDELRNQAQDQSASDSGKLKLFRRILCPIDFEESSLMALELAGRLVAQNDSQLYVLYAFPTLPIPLRGDATDPLAAQQSARQKLAQVVSRHLPGANCELLVIEGDPAERIIAAQSALSVDLIVMGTHGRGGISRLILGSVAQKVVREATSPVLTTRRATSLPAGPHQAKCRRVTVNVES
jgi:nucleotide-binding universal stress UspA family protein